MVLLLVASCGRPAVQEEPAPSANELLSAEADAVLADCDRQWREGLLPNREARARCIATRQLAIYRKYDYPFIDLIVLLNRKRIELARREDRGYPPGPLMAEWRESVAAVRGEDARRTRFLQEELRRLPRAERDRLARLNQTYRSPRLAQTRCVWAGARLSCYVDLQAGGQNP